MGQYKAWLLSYGCSKNVSMSSSHKTGYIKPVWRNATQQILETHQAYYVKVGGHNI